MSAFSSLYARSPYPWTYPTEALYHEAANEWPDGVASRDGSHVDAHHGAALVQKVQVVDHGRTKCLCGGSSKGTDNIAPQETVKGLGRRTPNVADTQEQRPKAEDRPLAKVVGQRNPHEVLRFTISVIASTMHS